MCDLPLTLFSRDTSSESNRFSLKFHGHGQCLRSYLDSLLVHCYHLTATKGVNPSGGMGTSVA
jgi:hypothetical protein